MEQVFPARQTWRKMIHMETTLTTWEAKERAGLLALETDEWREKRIAAEDPDTTADVLEHFALEVDTAFHHDEADSFIASCFAKTTLCGAGILANPNAPPGTLASLLNLRLPLGLNALLSNPVTPLLCLETPFFWREVFTDVCQSLLAHGSVPRSIVDALASDKEEAVAQAAQLHVALAEEI